MFKIQSLTEATGSDTEKSLTEDPRCIGGLLQKLAPSTKPDRDDDNEISPKQIRHRLTQRSFRQLHHDPYPGYQLHWTAAESIINMGRKSVRTSRHGRILYRSQQSTGRGTDTKTLRFSALALVSPTACIAVRSGEISHESHRPPSLPPPPQLNTTMHIISRTENDKASPPSHFIPHPLARHQSTNTGPERVPSHPTQLGTTDPQRN